MAAAVREAAKDGLFGEALHEDRAKCDATGYVGWS